MQDSSHYRKEARKFIDQAKSAKSPEHRVFLLEKAQTLIRLAEQAERTQHIAQDQEPPDNKLLSTP